MIRRTYLEASAGLQPGVSFRLLKIDGSEGEGGGQILRTSLVFSFVLGREIEVYNIRAKRDNPGLRPQHLAVVNSFAEATGGKVENARVGSDSIAFFPGSRAGGVLEVNVGTAGSITLILQTLLTAFSMKGVGAYVTARGGTDTRWSPTYDYFEKVFGPAARALGVPLSLRLKRRGYYPAGGGVVEGRCLPAEPPSFVRLDAKPKDAKASIFSVCSGLPITVAQRQADSAASVLRQASATVDSVNVSQEEADSPGTSIAAVHVEEGRVFLSGDAVGERGVRAEDVGASAASRLATTMGKGASVDPNLSDMLVPLMALRGGGEMVTSEVTQHLRTNIAVAETFTGCLHEIVQEGSLWRIRIKRQERSPAPAP